MPGMRGAGPVAALLLAMLLAACTASEVKPTLIMVQEIPPPGDGKTPVTREAAQICAEKTRNKGIKSVTAIFSRLRPGKADEEFAACMREQGFATGGASAAGEATEVGE